MIHKVRLENFKGHMDTTVSLGRLTMLVGSNGSGKTSVLEALSMQSMLGTRIDLTLQGERARMRLLRRSSDTLVVTSEGTRREGEGTKLPWSSRIELKRDDSASDGWSAQLDAEVTGQRFRIEQRFPGGERCGAIPVAEAPAWKALGDLFRPVHVFELDARSIAAGTFGAARADRGLDERGTKTAGLLAHLQRNQNERFQRVEDGLRRLVPFVRRVRLQPALREGQEGCSIVFDLEGSSGAPAHEAGRGTLLALALLTLLHGSPRSNLVLLDGLDHGLHPDAQLLLVRMIQDALTLEALDDVQVVATTHSPYMLDRLDLDDIQVFTLRPDGTVASKRLAEHPVAENARGAVSAGQLWSMDAEREWVLEGGCVDSSTGSSSR